MSAPTFTRVGKEILADGAHYADAADEKAAEHLLSCLTGWQPIDTAPLGDEDNGPFFDVCWQGETHRYLPVLLRETDCYNDGRGIKRQHSYPAVTIVFLRKPTHWRFSTPVTA